MPEIKSKERVYPSL